MINKKYEGCLFTFIDNYFYYKTMISNILMNILHTENKIQN